MVPFGTGKERFKSDHRTLPGPGSYEMDALQLTKPIAVKRMSPSPRTSPPINRVKLLNKPDLFESNSLAEISLDASKVSLRGQGRMAKNLIENQQSWTFKSKEPKVAIYRAEEKRIHQLYGSRQGLKYKIKLNDKILDTDGSNS